MRLTSFVLSLATMLAGAACHAGTVTLFDGTFAGGDWIFQTDGTGGGQVGVNTSASQFPLGGDPGAFRRNEHSAYTPGRSVMRSWNFNNSATYDPADGAIESVDLSSNVLRIGGTYESHHLYFAVRQDGLLFRTETGFPVIGDNTQWEGSSLMNASSGDFELFFNGIFLPTGTPDFTVSGGEIEFGYMLETVGVQSYNSQTGIDNWLVEITTESAPIPEPATLVVALLGIGLVAMRRTLGLVG